MATQNATQEEWYTAREVGERFRLDRNSITKMCQQGRIPHIRIGKAVRIPAAWVEKQSKAYSLEGAHAELSESQLALEGQRIMRALAAAERQGKI